MSQEEVRNESVRLMFDLLHFEKHLHTVDGDMVWDKIINDVMEYDRLSNLYMGDPAVPCPIQQSERPDIIYHCDDFTMGIECFRFDASKKTKKGSTQKQQEVIIDKKHRIEYQKMEDKPDGLIVIKDTVKAKFTLENYTAALLSSFRSHKKSIDEYRQTVSTRFPDKKNYLSFYIEDATAIGNYVNSHIGVEALNPLCIREFIDEIAQTEGLDYVVIKHQVIPYVYGIHIQKINAEFIDSLYNESYDFSRDKYVQYTYSRESRFHHKHK